MRGSQDDLGLLRERLTECAELYLTADLNGQRLAITDTLLAIAAYLQGRDFPPEALLMLIRPGLALAARQGNRLDPLFSERPRGGRPSKTANDHMRTAILAVLADAWLRARQDDPREQSLKLAEAARMMSGGWFGNMSGAKLKAAREIIRQEAKDHLAVEFAEGFGRLFHKVAAQFGVERAFRMMVRYIDVHEVSGLIKS